MPSSADFASEGGYGAPIRLDPDRGGPIKSPPTAASTPVRSKLDKIHLRLNIEDNARVSPDSSSETNDASALCLPKPAPCLRCADALGRLAFRRGGAPFHELSAPVRRWPSACNRTVAKPSYRLAVCVRSYDRRFARRTRRGLRPSTLAQCLQ